MHETPDSVRTMVRAGHGLEPRLLQANPTSRYSCKSNSTGKRGGTFLAHPTMTSLPFAPESVKTQESRNLQESGKIQNLFSSAVVGGGCDRE